MKRMLIPAVIAVMSAFVMSCAGPDSRQDKVFDIKDFGAVGDGVTECTEALNAAIDSCSRAGGGIVSVPAGKYLTNTIFLRDNVELRLEKDAVILGVDDPERYSSYVPAKDMTKYDTGSVLTNINSTGDARWTRTLILGVGLSNVAITGEGTIDGRHLFDARGEESMRGPHGIIIAESKDVRVENIHITCASNYAFLGYELENAVFKGLYITEGWDGIHIRGGKNIEIYNCRFETGDDSIAGGYWDGFRVHDCDINTSCNGVRLMQPAENLEVYNCVFHGPGVYPHRTSGRHNMLYGLILEPGGWGPAPGTMRGIYIHDVTMDHLQGPVSTGVRPECDAYDLTIENLSATGVEDQLCPIMPLHDTGFKTITLNNISVSR